MFDCAQTQLDCSAWRTLQTAGSHQGSQVWDGRSLTRRIWRPNLVQDHRLAVSGRSLASQVAKSSLGQKSCLLTRGIRSLGRAADSVLAE